MESEARRSMVAHHGGMDCHASLAMTGKRYFGNFHIRKAGQGSALIAQLEARGFSMPGLQAGHEFD